MADTPEFISLGSSGLHRTTGFIHEDFLKELQGIHGVRTYKEMRDNDPIVGAMLFAIDMLIRNVEWRIDPGGDSQEDLNAAEFIRTVLFEDMENTFQEVLSEFLSFLPFGWSWHEMNFKRRLGQSNDMNMTSKFDDGRIGFLNLPLRSQDTLWEWEFDDDDRVTAMVQQAPPRWITQRIPMEKSLLFRTRIHKNNPEGRSVLRNAYRPWYFKKKIENIEGIGIERDLAGLPKITAPARILDRNNKDANAIATRVELERIIKNVRRDEQEGILLPGGSDKNGDKLYTFELMTSGGKRQFDTDKIVRRYQQSMAMTVMADFLLLGHEQVGTQALSTNKTHMFSTAIGAWKTMIQDIMNNKAIPQLFRFNTFTIEKLPTLESSDVETVDLEEIGNYIEKLSGAGVRLFPDDKLETHLKEQANFPSTPEEERQEVAVARETPDPNANPKDIEKSKKPRAAQLNKRIQELNNGIGSGKIRRAAAIQEVVKMGISKSNAEIILGVKR